MRYFSEFVWAPLMVFLALAQGCALIPEEAPEKSPPIGLIMTPPTYYSTQKAKYLGYKYQENLSRLIERIVRDPKTANLQFANNIASVGGIGFFTHSATKVPDERYLEVILAAPETFERKSEYSSKLHRLVSLYGRELLTILSSDGEIYREKQVAGYGLNFSWRTIASEASGPRVIVERAIAYFPKEEVREFLNKKIVENNLLRNAVIFVAEADGPMSLVSYRPQERKPDFRPPIQEEILAEGRDKPRDEPTPVAVSKPESREQIDAEKQRQRPETAARKVTAQSETSSKTTTLKAESNVVSDKAKEPLAVTASSAALKERDGREAPEKGSAQQPAARQSNTVSKPAERDNDKSSSRTAAHGVPAEKMASASPLSQGSGIQRKPTEIAGEQEASATRGAPSVGGGATPKKAEAAAGLNKEVSGSVPDVKREAHTVNTGRLSPVVESKSPVEMKPAVGGSEAPSKTGETIKDEVHAPRAVSSADVEPIENKVSRLPPVAVPPKAGPAVSTPLESSRQAEPAQTHPAPPVRMKKEARDDRQQPSTSKSAEKLHPVARPAPERAEASANSGGTAKEKEREPQPVVTATAEDEKAETKIPALAAEAKTEPKPSSERRTITRERVEPLPRAVARAERPVAEKTVALPAAPVAPPKHIAPSPDQTADKRGGQKLAVLTTKPSAPVEEEKPAVGSPRKMLKGYIIQIAFMDKAEAQHWAETLERRGYAVSVTKAGGSGSLRVRIGNFPVRHEAERELKSLAKSGLNGIVLNLPDGYRPTDGASNGD